MCEDVILASALKCHASVGRQSQGATPKQLATAVGSLTGKWLCFSLKIRCGYINAVFDSLGAD